MIKYIDGKCSGFFQGDRAPDWEQKASTAVKGIRYNGNGGNTQDSGVKISGTGLPGTSGVYAPTPAPAPPTPAPTPAPTQR